MVPFELNPLAPFVLDPLSLGFLNPLPLSSSIPSLWRCSILWPLLSSVSWPLQSQGFFFVIGESFLSQSIQSQSHGFGILQSLTPFELNFLATSISMPSVSLGLRDPLAPSVSIPCFWNCSVSLSSIPRFFLGSVPCFWDSSFPYPFLARSLVLGITESLAPFGCSPMYFGDW